MPSSELNPRLFYCDDCGLVLAQTEEDVLPVCPTSTCNEREPVVKEVGVHTWEPRY